MSKIVLSALEGVPAVSWQGCYDETWKGILTPRAFKHPAKMARGLIRRIFATLLDRGWLARGGIVVDPFGGVGTTGVEAAWRGCRFAGAEIEPEFHALSLDNFKAREPWHLATGRPLPEMVLGDSRRLCALLGTDGRGADAVVGSPPFSPPGANPNGQGQGVSADYKAGKMKHASSTTTYGQTAGQMGKMGMAGEGDTFWKAARAVLAQCHALLRPGGVMAWHSKDFVREGARVPFTADWARLCASLGLRPVLHARALMVREKTQATLLDGDVVRLKERKSFFRRLVERNGAPRIDHEDVVFFLKPE